MEVTNDHLKDTFNQCRDGMITSELAQRLQGISEDINFGDKSGVTMLHVACCNGNFVIVQELLKQEHINIETKDRYERTVLHAAVLGHKFTEHPKEAYKASTPYYRKENTAYFKASEPNSEEQIEVIKILLMREESSRCFIQQKLYYALFELAIRANVKPCILQYLVSEMRLKRTVDDCNDALEVAVRRDNMTLLAVMAEDPLFDLNCITSDEESSLLGLAIGRNKLECMKFLLDHPGVNVNCMGTGLLCPSECSALIHAVQESVETEEEKKMKCEQLHILMFHSRIDINSVPSQSGEYPIHRAVLNKNLLFLRTFLQHPQIDVNTKSRGEFSPLKLAALLEYENHVELLLSHRKTKLNHDLAESDRAIPTMSDIVDYGTSQIILKAIAAGGDPNTKAWSDSKNCYLNLFELNLLLCAEAEADELSEMEDRLQAGQILLEAGCHPIVSQSIIDQINQKITQNTSWSNSQKIVMENLKALPKTTVQSLASASRSALFKQARKVKGPYVTLDLMQQFISTKSMTKFCKEFLTFDNAIKCKLL